MCCNPLTPGRMAAVQHMCPWTGSLNQAGLLLRGWVGDHSQLCSVITPGDVGVPEMEVEANTFKANKCSPYFTMALAQDWWFSSCDI